VKAPWPDDRILVALDLQAQGLSASLIAARLGVTRSAVLGILHRVRVETDAVPCACVKPENKDGGMQAGWWRR
jgi:hypothetical protein